MSQAGADPGAGGRFLDSWNAVHGSGRDPHSPSSQHWAASISVAALIPVLGAVALGELHPLQQQRVALVGAALALLLAGWLWVIVLRGRLGYPMMLVGGVALSAVGHFTEGIVATAAMVVLVAMACPISWAAPLSLLPLTACVVIGVVQKVQVSVLVFLVLFLVFAFTIGRVVRGAREAQLRAQLFLEGATAVREERARSAALQERARIAREIHDILAHNLSALAVQLEGARVLFPPGLQGKESQAHIERAQRLARQGLAEVRQAVSTLRGDALPNLALLAELIADFERDTGVPCRLTMAVDRMAVPFDVQLAIYRTAQEALTNIRKHSLPHHVELDVRGELGKICLVVNSVASPAAADGLADTGGGNGLVGIRERAALLDGILEAGPTDRGYRVMLELPL